MGTIARAIRKDEIAAIPAPILKERGSEFLQSSKATAQLIGFKIIEFENGALNLSPTELQNVKKRYSDFVNGMLGKLASMGFKEGVAPKDEKELKSLCKAILISVWDGSTQVMDAPLLATAFGKSKKRELDCDTSSFIFAELLLKFKVESMLVSVPEHILLCVKAGNTQFYLETSSSLPGAKIITYDASALKQKYGPVYGVCEFSEEPSFITYFNRGRVKSLRKDHQGAIADYNESIRLNKNFASAYNNRGYAWATLGKLETDGEAKQNYYLAAIADYTEAIRLNQKYAYAYNNRGNAYFALGNYQNAIVDFTIALLIQPDYANTYNNRGIAYFMLKEYGKAMDDYCAAIRSDGNFADAYGNRGYLELFLGDQKARENDPASAKKYYQSAVSDFTEAIRINRNLAVAYYYRSYCYRALNMDKEAKADYDEALRLGFKPKQ